MKFDESAFLASADATFKALRPECRVTVGCTATHREPSLAKTRLGRHYRTPGWFEVTLGVQLEEDGVLTACTKRLLWDPAQGPPLPEVQLGAAMAGMMVAAIVEEVSDGEEEQSRR